MIPPASARAAAPHPLAGLGTDPNYVFSLLTFLEDRNDKARAAAAAEARAQADRYRAHMEMFLERERLAAKERIAQLQAPANGIAPALLERLAMIEGRLEERDDDDDDLETSGDGSSSTPGGIDWNPIIQTVIGRFGPRLEQRLRRVGEHIDEIRNEMFLLDEQGRRGA